MFQYLIDRGVPIDQANKNPNKWTRIPGVKRGNSEQWLVATNKGPESYADWISEITGL